MKQLLVILSVLLIISRVQSGRSITAIEQCENVDDYPGKLDFNYDKDSLTASGSLHLPFDIDENQACSVVIYKQNEVGDWEHFSEVTSNLLDMKNKYLQTGYRKMRSFITPSIDSESFVSANDYEFKDLKLNDEDCTTPNVPGKFKIHGEILDKGGEPGLCLVVYLTQ